MCAPIHFCSHTAVLQNQVLRWTHWISCSRQSSRSGVSQVNVVLLKEKNGFFKKLTVKQKCAKISWKLGQRKSHNILVITSPRFGRVNDCTVQWQIPRTWLCSKPRPRPQIQCADFLFQKRIDFKHQDIDCFGVVSVWGIAAAALGLGSAPGTPLGAGLVPLCPVIADDVVEPCELN